MAQNIGNARNILVGASPLFLSVEDSTTSGYVENLVPGTAVTGAVGRNKTVPAFKNGTAGSGTPVVGYVAGESYITTLNGQRDGGAPILRCGENRPPWPPKDVITV